MPDAIQPADLGFGRSHIAPLISRFVRQYPQVEVQLQLSVNPPPLTEDAFDVCIRFGEPPDARVIAQRLAPNRRLSSGRGAAVTTEAVKTRGTLTTNDGEIAVNWALDGHGILMHPQTHAIWHRVAPTLARQFTLVMADLRGYGASSKPPGDAGPLPCGHCIAEEAPDALLAGMLTFLIDLTSPRSACTGSDTRCPGRTGSAARRPWRRSRP